MTIKTTKHICKRTKYNFWKWKDKSNRKELNRGLDIAKERINRRNDGTEEITQSTPKEKKMKKYEGDIEDTDLIYI